MNKCKQNSIHVFRHLFDWHIRSILGGRLFQIVVLSWTWKHIWYLWISLSTLSCLKCFEILLLLRVSIRSTRQVGKRASKDGIFSKDCFTVYVNSIFTDTGFLSFYFQTNKQWLWEGAIWKQTPLGIINQ